MNVKKHIRVALEKQGIKVSEHSVGRYISGARKPDITVGKALASMTESPLVIWIDPAESRARRNTLNVYSKKTGTVFHARRGRPRKGV